jgi:hypothetical protein
LWYRYPNMTGATAPMNNEAWKTAFPRGGDNTRSYLVWWFHHVPRSEGRAPDGRLNNWWRYFANHHERYKSQY